jgi:hypothetical protein
LGLGAPPLVPPREFTLRLHFAELDDAKPGQRVFDVKVQGRTVLDALDVAREAGVGTALVKEFQHVAAGEAMTVEFVPRGTTLRRDSAPILNALEVVEDGFRTEPK